MKNQVFFFYAADGAGVEVQPSLRIEPGSISCVCKRQLPLRASSFGTFRTFLLIPEQES
jgi:hypothetical protein